MAGPEGARRIREAGRFTPPEPRKAHWVEHLRSACLSVGTYSMAPGGPDDQSPHTEDEVYFITMGRGRLVTSSVHNAAELWRARRAGAEIVFCSPVFPTGSHIGAATLGPFGWLRLARMAGPAKPFALGGIDSRSVRRLGKICAGIGAIEALLSG